MTLIAGTRIGSFEVTGLLGAGGMGEVYRARDLKLGREVAVKILPPALQSDPDRLARLAREARALAAINHPNIAAIYGVDEQDDTSALVLELVEGESLATRLRRGPIPIVEAIAIAKQIANALGAAHEHAAQTRLDHAQQQRTLETSLTDDRSKGEVRQHGGVLRQDDKETR